MKYVIFISECVHNYD